MKINHKKIKIFVFLFVISFSIIYFFSIGTSPFYGNYYMGDSLILLTIGKAVKAGKVLYKDIFDHKGPILFWIQLIGLYISDSGFGVFIIEIISLYFTNIFLYKSLNLITNNKNSMISIIFSMIFMSYFFVTGNHTEEYALPLLSLALFIALKWIKSNDKYSNKIYGYSYIYGLLFAIIAFTRLNNAAMICGLALAITILFMKEKKYKEIIKCAIFLIIGILTITIPILLYFYKIGDLKDMIYGTFIHNFLYVKAGINGDMSLKAKIILWTSLILLLLFNIKKKYNEKEYLLVLVITYVSTFFTLTFGTSANHYFIIMTPLFSVCIIPIIELFNSKEISSIFKYFIITDILIIYTLGCFIPQIYYKFHFNNSNLSSISGFVEKNIPRNDKDKVLAMGMYTSSIYLFGNIIPCYKYAFLQDYLFYSNPKLIDETFEYLKQKNVKYIFYSDLEKIQNKDKIQQFILENYRKKDSLTIIDLYEFKEYPKEYVLYELK